MTYVSAQDRRVQARDVARAYLNAGNRFEDLSLRYVAAQLGIPLSTLTYVYSSVTDLLDDFQGTILESFEVGPGGLRAELGRFLGASYTMMRQEPAVRELLRFEATRVGSGRGPAQMESTIDLFTRIRRQGRENYRVPDDLLARLFRYQLDGAVLHWLELPDASSDRWYRDTMAAIDFLTIAADPRPIGQPHDAPPFPLPDYDRIKLPRTKR